MACRSGAAYSPETHSVLAFAATIGSLLSASAGHSL